VAGKVTSGWQVKGKRWSHADAVDQQSTTIIAAELKTMIRPDTQDLQWDDPFLSVRMIRLWRIRKG
jgi:hypothetical protein